MAAELRPLREGLFERAGASRRASFVAYRANRISLAFVIALLPAIVLAALALAFESVAATMTNERAIREFFARAFSAVVTASAIAVSVATFTFGRELRDLRTLREHYDENMGHRARLRAAIGHEVPLAIAPFIRASLTAISESARDVQETAAVLALQARVGGVDLQEYLRHVIAATERTREVVHGVQGDPSKLNLAVADFDHDVADFLAGAFARDVTLPRPVRESLSLLRERIKDHTITAQYTKTLAYQWGLSRMSIAILVAIVPSVSAAALMVLAYPSDFASRLGPRASIALVALAFAAVLLPLALFLSYVLRFVTFNELTLPTAGFVLVSERD